MNLQRRSAFLASDPVIDWRFPAVHDLAARLCDSTPESTARRCFEWVRDRIRHSTDSGDTRLTCSASEVLRHGTGLCYGKAHLLAALLRANDIAAGLCYQRLAISPGVFALHGIAAAFLPELGWYRIDPAHSIASAAFTPPVERLPFAATAPGEQDDRTVHAAAHPVVVNALRAHPDVTSLLAAGLPDSAGHQPGVGS